MALADFLLILRECGKIKIPDNTVDYVMEAELQYDILSKKQRDILPHLDFLKERRIYLAGGTALALQIGHRKSIDFDFYTLHEFELDEMVRKFRQSFKTISVVQMSSGTLIVDVEGVQVSVFSYDYRVIRPFIDSTHLLLISLEDISAMKIIAVIQRGEKRDFIDTYFLIQRFGLEHIFSYCEEKYAGIFNPYLALQALTYFEDAEASPPGPRIALYNDRPSWEEAKEYLVRAAAEYKREKLK